MNFIPKFESEMSSPPEISRQQIDSANQWINAIDFSDGLKEWQDTIESSEHPLEWQDTIDMAAEASCDASDASEKSMPVLSRFEESEQTKQMVEYLNNMPELRRENWINLSIENRVGIVQKIEHYAAKVGCRPSLNVETATMGKSNLGYMDWGTQKIVINEAVLSSNKSEDFRNVIKTIVHEGRHAYQYSNVMLQRTEPNDEKYRAWAVNLATGYCAVKLFGFKQYYLQPLEVDARVFSEAIVSKIKDL